MTKKAKKISVYVSLVVIPFGATTLGLVGKANHAKQLSTVDATQETDGAFTDGLFLGKLDAEAGKAAEPSIARWNDPKDRASFLAGYQRGYEEARARKISAHRR